MTQTFKILFSDDAGFAQDPRSQGRGRRGEHQLEHFLRRGKSKNQKNSGASQGRIQCQKSKGNFKKCVYRNIRNIKKKYVALIISRFAVLN